MSIDQSLSFGHIILIQLHSTFGTFLQSFGKRPHLHGTLTDFRTVRRVRGLAPLWWTVPLGFWRILDRSISVWGRANGSSPRFCRASRPGFDMRSWAFQNPNRLAPSEHPNPTTKIGSLKWVVNSPTPKMGSQTGFDSHSHVETVPMRVIASDRDERGIGAAGRLLLNSFLT